MGNLSTLPFVRWSFPTDLRMVRRQRSINGCGSAVDKEKKTKGLGNNRM